MALRTVALCDNKFIGIESIYTVINNKQINIPNKLADLREKSRNNELFCPCGCGSNLILVASENNLREQHFRLKNGEFNKDCQAIIEGKRSVDSKIILKCWLDDKLHDDNMESRVPVFDVSDTERRFEFTFLSKEQSVGISYCHDRVNISDVKLKLLADNSSGIILTHILDACNFKADGQYPEAEMKIQSIQGFCLLLDIYDEKDYYEADMRAVFYAQNLDGLWDEVVICDSKLSKYYFTNGAITYNGETVKSLADKLKKQYDDRLQAERLAHETYEKEQRELAERRHAIIQRAREADERRRAEEAERRKTESVKLAEQRRIEEEQREIEKIHESIKERIGIKERLNQQEVPVYDSDGNRWVRCKYCGFIGLEEFFPSRGGANRINLGICSACSKNNPEVKNTPEILNQTIEPKKRNNNECPMCGGKLVERNGRYGKFLGCNRYPKCDYTQSLGCW